MPWTTRTLPLALACLVACGDPGKTSDAGTDGASTTNNNGSTGPASTSTASTATTDVSGSGTDGQTTSTTTGPGTTTDATGGSTTSGSTGGSSTTGSTGPETTGMTGPDTTGMTGNNTTGDMCVGQGQSCAMGQTCCDGLECCEGVPVPPGKEFCSNNCPISDRNAKADFLPLDVHDVLARVVSLDITTWRYKKDTPDVRHLGPMAQDFKAAFGLGDTDKMIFPLDATGVSMAAIQALHQRLAAAEAENDDLRARLGRLERRLAELESR